MIQRDEKCCNSNFEVNVKFKVFDCPANEFMKKYYLLRDVVVTGLKHFTSFKKKDSVSRIKKF